ncbi:hypothetical protein G5V59_00335 [Nocardioides sp. W3-2-3]|uniref:hypothetical protein n=1 Tax=Nocardioides convexus TaxID=2712224 RepID=UPI0024188ABE|nr:hypothetical protein [Nocardioides convexus]NGZ99418.1 hypothetical protein [Nocardioides convexus]
MSRRRPRSTAGEITEMSRAAGVELTPWQQAYLERVYPPREPRRRPRWRLVTAFPRKRGRLPHGFDPHDTPGGL